MPYKALRSEVAVTTIRTAVLVDQRDVKLGTVKVPDATFAIQHDGAIFIRTEKGVRLGGGAIGVVFLETEPLVREKLNPI